MKFIDSNVLVYFADGRNPKKQSMARAILVNAMGNQPDHIAQSLPHNVLPTFAA